MKCSDGGTTAMTTLIQGSADPVDHNPIDGGTNETNADGAIPFPRDRNDARWSPLRRGMWGDPRGGRYLPRARLGRKSARWLDRDVPYQRHGQLEASRLRQDQHDH